MASSSLDIPEHARGTVRIGETIYHYERSTKTGALMLVVGPDTRDWFAIDRGALDYTAVARQEHDIPGFTGHDGPKIAQACAICNGTALDGAPALKDARVTQKVLAGQTAQTLEPQTTPDTLTAEVEANLRAQTAEAEIGRLRAMLDHQDEATMSGVTGAADPAHNAGIPPSDPDVIAGAAPDIQTAAIIQAQHRGMGHTVSRTPELQADADAAKEADEAAFDAKIAAATAPPERIATDQEWDTAIHDAFGGEQGTDIRTADVPPPNLTPPPAPQRPGDKAATDNQLMYEQANPGQRAEDATGKDPWTGADVPISWKVPGASPDKPYGARNDGTPRRPPGHKAKK